MNVINMPGFTANASLGTTNTQYRRPSVWTTSDPAHAIVPQNWLGDLFRQMGSDLEGVGELLWGGIKCSAATANLAAKCFEGAEIGDGSECSNAGNDWVENCWND